MLRHIYKRIGIWLFFLTFLTAVLLSFQNTNDWASKSVKSTLLEVFAFIALGLISFSSDKNDNEYLNYLRFRSIAITVLLSFIYALADSFIFTVSHLLIMEVFQIQLIVYILVFNLLKKIQ
ncbi:hypothetical protein [Fulvivirga lutimaris]|uniref:hypothetical protein n=1 Tax=Fulvivirga lutimaris TaxID=1819566 RepID=UPI0012BCCDC4|nr:hypothetical protein [Fulvivirga lutimaris]MTI38614.1 hypothetical protein [Fulvivirga lutimaris]